MTLCVCVCVCVYRRLAGTAQVEKTGDAFMDTFLMLPTDALAIMSAQLTFE